jgi:hypothetical protein
VEKTPITEDTPNSLLQIEHSVQRKAAIARGKGTDHAGVVTVKPIQNFDLDNTIFTTLEGKIPRLFMTAKIAKELSWDNAVSQTITQEYEQAIDNSKIPPIDKAIIHFMESECDFSAEHADGTFLEHLLFCYEYSVIHYPEHSALVMLLHSILGTGTNTFAMEVSKLPKLNSLISEFEMTHIEAFPSFLRLLYQQEFFAALHDNSHRLDKLESVGYHRVIDNEKKVISAQDFWIQLNYQLIHYVDFLPAANWSSNLSDPVVQSFIDLSQFLDSSGKRMAQVGFVVPTTSSAAQRESFSIGSRLSSLVPTRLKKKLAAKSIRRFSELIGHDLQFEFSWKE